MRNLGWMGVAACLLTGVAAADVPDGWSIARDGAACEADNPQGGGAMVTLAVMPPQHLLLLQHPDFPTVKQSQTVTLSFDGAAPISLEAMGSDHIYGFGITPELGLALRQAKTLTATVNGKQYVYRFAHADAAMDEAAHCAGTKTLPEVWNDAPKPISGVPGWMIMDGLGGTDQCTVRRNSPEVNTSLILSQTGRLIVVAGRPDWAKWGGEVKATLAIDDAPPLAVSALGFQNLVMLAPADDAMIAKLEGAKTLLWHLPWGEFRADVAGLGAAEAALRACNAKHGPPH